MIKCLPNTVRFFLKLPVHKSVCVFFKGIYHQFQVGFLLQHILRTDDLKKKFFFSLYSIIALMN